MTEEDMQRVRELIELGVRRYFDHYLEEVFPKQIASAIQSHDEKADAHGGILSRFAQFKWTLLGFVAAFGGGLGIERVFGVLFG